MTHTPRIAYDARMAIGAYRGMGRYLRSLIAGRESEMLGICAEGESDPQLQLVAHGPRFHPAWEQLSLPRTLLQERVDIFLAPFNTAPLWLPGGIKLVLIVHDLIYMEKLPSSPSLYQNAGRLYRRFVVPRVVPRADLLLTVSTYTASQLITRFDVPAENIRVIPNSLDAAWFAPHPTSEREREDYILMVSGEAPSKNLPRALEAYAALGQNRPRLVIAGVATAAHPHFQQLATRLGVGGAVEFLRRISDEQMISLYRRARLFFLPSIAEGFGIPLVEAMASGTPVVASRSTCLPDVGGDAAIYCDPLSAAEMSAALRYVLENDELQRRLSAAGTERARRFHQARVQQQIHIFWDEILKAQP